MTDRQIDVVSGAGVWAAAVPLALSQEARYIRLYNRSAFPVRIRFGDAGGAILRLEANGTAGDFRQRNYQPREGPTEVAAWGEGGVATVAVHASTEDRRFGDWPAEGIGAGVAAVVAGFRMYTTTLAQSIPSGPVTPVDFDTVDDDASGMITSLAPGLITIIQPGPYSFFGLIQWDTSPPNPGFWWLEITVNGARTIAADYSDGGAAVVGSEFENIQRVSTRIDLVAGDTVELQCAQTGTAAQLLIPAPEWSSHFAGQYLGA